MLRRAYELDARRLHRDARQALQNARFVLCRDRVLEQLRRQPGLRGAEPRRAGFESARLAVQRRGLQPSQLFGAECQGCQQCGAVDAAGQLAHDAGGAAQFCSGQLPAQLGDPVIQAAKLAQHGGFSRVQLLAAAALAGFERGLDAGAKLGAAGGELIDEAGECREVMELPRSPNGDGLLGRCGILTDFSKRMSEALKHDQRGCAGRMCCGEKRRRQRGGNGKEDRFAAPEIVEHRGDAVGP